MAQALFKRLQVVTVSLLALSALAFAYGRLSYAAPNVYAPYLAFDAQEVRRFATCQSGGYAAQTPLYCYRSNGGLSISFSLDDFNRVVSVALFETPAPVSLGDLIAWYGMFDRANTTRRWSAFYWHMPQMTILATTRHNNLYARVTFIHFGLQTVSQTALP